MHPRLAPSLLALLALAGGCYLHHERGDAASGASSAPGAGAAGSLADLARPAADSLVPALPPTQPPRECTELQDVELAALPVDMLFVVDDSGSMREEQAALAREFPQMVRVLTTGDLDGDGEPDFPPVGDLHLGVVSSNMGVAIRGVAQCEGLGRDGVLSTMGGGVGCHASYPSFLSFDAAGRDEPALLAQDFACVASLGTDGCGFEHQLEAALKALWPADDVTLPTGHVIRADAVTFLPDASGAPTRGHGTGANAGFLRHQGPLGSSLLAVVVVSDEEDCSAAERRIFTPDVYLPEDHPLAQQDLNARCFLNPDALYPVERYLNGLRALRAGADYLVFYAAIVGVPPDLVDAEAREAVDFADPVARDGYYDAILDDPRMREQLDPASTEETGDRLLPSCETESGKAYPPRRFVELARGFGDNAVVQSICQDDFRPAMEAILTRLGETITVATCAFQDR